MEKENESVKMESLMKKVLCFLMLIFVISLFAFSLSFADYANYAAPQLQWISNAFPGLWDRQKADVLRMMAMFPDYECTDYGDQVACTSKFNRNENNNIFINWFLDDYEEHHDNLWKVSVTVDLNASDQQQELFYLLWLDGLKPARSDKFDFTYKGVMPLNFSDEKTNMVAYLQQFDHDINPFLLVEYYRR
jgi:hypothetical protein